MKNQSNKKAVGSGNYQQLVKGLNSACNRLKAVAQQRTHNNHVLIRAKKLLCVNRNTNQRRRLMKKHKAPPGYKYIFVKCFRHYITGKLVYPKKSQYFRFLVKE